MTLQFTTQYSRHGEHTRHVLCRHLEQKLKIFSSSIMIHNNLKIYSLYSDYLDKDVPNVLNRRETGRWYYWVKVRLSKGITMVGHSWGRNIKEILVVLTVLQQTQSQSDSALEGLPRQPRTDSKWRIFYFKLSEEIERTEQRRVLRN